MGVKQNPNEADAIYDILIPLLIMIGLFVVNGFILMIIWRYRKKRYFDYGKKNCFLDIKPFSISFFFRKNLAEDDGLARL